MPRVVPSQIVGLIDEFFPFIADKNSPDPDRSYDWGSLPKLAPVIELIDQLPQELITLGPDQYVVFVKSVTAIRAMIGRWQGTTDRTPLYSFPDGSPVRLLRDVLLLCPDEFPAPGTANMNFIQDHELRQSLQLDLSAVNRALSNSEWKAATVLAGSIIEALLLWALQQKSLADIQTAVTNLVNNHTLTSNPGLNLENWLLPFYIEVAAELKVIKQDTATEARLAKDFRNLIHPGRAQRRGQVCDRGTAFSAVAAVEHVVRDLI